MDWISMNERTPVVGERVIYFAEVVGTFMGVFDGGTCERDGMFSSRSGFLTGDVSHWMPIPAPPPGLTEPEDTE